MGEPAAEERGSRVVPQQACLVAEKPDHQELPGECPAFLPCPLMAEHGLQWMPAG